MGAIYLITNVVNGKRYVGQTRDAHPKRRWREHRNAALGQKEQTYKSRTAICRAMRKYGLVAFEFSVIETCSDADLDAREAQWIIKLRTLRPHGYNLTAGGKTALRTAEVGERIARANRGRVKTPEWRAALSVSSKGRPRWTLEERAAIGDRQRGRIQSDESNQKRSLALKGRSFGPHSDERRRKIAVTLTGRKLSADSIAKRTAKQKGMKRSPETRERLRIAALARKRNRAQPAESSWLLTRTQMDQEAGKLPS